jgi:hypothetical protein
MVRDRLKNTRVAFLNLSSGSQQGAESLLQFDPVPGEDEFFQAVREAIDENRQRENEAAG